MRNKPMGQVTAPRRQCKTTEGVPADQDGLKSTNVTEGNILFKESNLSIYKYDYFNFCNTNC